MISCLLGMSGIPNFAPNIAKELCLENQADVLSGVRHRRTVHLCLRPVDSYTVYFVFACFFLSLFMVLFCFFFLSSLNFLEIGKNRAGNSKKLYFTKKITKMQSEKSFWNERCSCTFLYSRACMFPK